MSAKDTTHAPRTVGVEEELLLVNAGTGRPTAGIESVLTTAARFAGTAEGGSLPLTHLEHEAKQEQVEAVSAPCDTLAGVAAALAAGRRLADLAAQGIGARAVGLGTSVLPVSSHLTRGPRYARIEDQFGLTMTEQLTCGFHVHVSIVDDEEGVAVLDRIRPWLPAVLALSGNSPIWKGRASGFSSYRYQVWTRWPGSGAYDVFGSADVYRRTVRAFLATGVPLDPGMLYFDARLSARFPTVEIRVADACTDLAHAVGLAGIIRALVETAAREWRSGTPPHAVTTPLLRLAMWSASRYGLSSTLVDPHSGEPRDARAVVDALLSHVAPVLHDLGDEHRVATAITDLFANGTGAERQLRVLERTGRPSAVVVDAVDRTHRFPAQA